MAVTRDANASATLRVTATTSVNFNNLTIGAHSNLALIVPIIWDTAGITGISVVWDSGGTNQTVTQIGTSTTSTTGRADLYGLINPTQGNKTLAVSWTGSAQITMNATSYFNVDQTGGVTTFYGFAHANATSAAPSVTVASAVGDFVVDSAMSLANFTGITSGSQLGLDNSGTATFATAEITGGASVSSGWTLSASQVWVDVACGIKAFAAAGSGGKSNMLMGVRARMIESPRLIKPRWI